MAFYDNAVQSFKDAASFSNDYIQKTVLPGIKQVQDFLFSTPDLGEKKLFVVGRPYAFNAQVDPYKRLSNYIRTKMSVIDLIPCSYTIDFKKVEESKGFGNSGVYTMDYTTKIDEFRDLCIHHGLTKPLNSHTCPWSGVRLYTTDETSATDSFNVQYKDSMFQGYVDKAGELSRNLQEVVSAVTGKTQQIAKRTGTAAGEGAARLAKYAKSSDSTSAAIQQAVTSLSDILLQGNRLTFPKIWQNTTHTGNLSATVKLVSPYGSPTAVREFIIKPLMFLIILASPQTRDGISYGNSIPLTIKAYGMNYTILGAINSITLRRGGNDTSFNIYRQPLTIDVSIDFQTLYDGFAVYNKGKDGDPKQPPDHNIFMSPRLINPNSSEIVPNEPSSPLSTMGTVLNSLRPMNLVEGNFQVYGNFIRPDRPDIPNSTVNVQLAGNVIVPSVLKTDQLNPFASVLDSAKKTTGQIGSQLNTWKSTAITSSADTLRGKIKQNFKGWGNL